jgi:hypothetical protein
MQIMKYVMYTCNVYIVFHFYFPEAFLQVKKLMEKTYSETEQNMTGKRPDYVALANEVRSTAMTSDRVSS